MTRLWFVIGMLAIGGAVAMMKHGMVSVATVLGAIAIWSLLEAANTMGD